MVHGAHLRVGWAAKPSGDPAGPRPGACPIVRAGRRSFLLAKVPRPGPPPPGQFEASYAPLIPRRHRTKTFPAYGLKPDGRIGLGPG